MTSPAQSNWLRIGRDILREYLKWFLAVWLLALVLASAIVGVVAYFGTPTVSIVDTILNSPRYWLFVIGLVFTYQWLGAYVACGVTRRDFTIGSGLAAVAMSLVAGMICTATMYAEGLVYLAADWKLGFENPHLFDTQQQWSLMLLEFCLAFAAHMFAGWVLGTLYYLHGAWATFAAIPVFGFAVGTELVLGSGWVARLVNDNVYTFTPSWLVALPTGSAVVLLLFGIVWVLLRRAPISPTKS